MDAQLERFLEMETERLGLRISRRQPIQQRMEQYVRLALSKEGRLTVTDDEVQAMVGLLMLQFDQPMRRVTRSMIQRG